MPQLPSGLKVALTTQPTRDEIRKGNARFNFLAKLNIQDSFDRFPEVVTVIYLNNKAAENVSSKDYQHGTQPIGADEYQFSQLFLADVGTDRCDWSKEDVEFLQAWLSTKSEQEWMQESHDELIEVINSSQTTLPESLKGILDVDDGYYPSVNLDKHEQELPDSVIKLVGELIKRDNVQSVSCPFNNSKVWRLLVNEQVHRAKLSDLPLQKAFTLCGPDGGFSFDPVDWGGDIHIPYEGACMADLFVMPEWHNLFIEEANNKGDQATLLDYVTSWTHPMCGFSCH
jgi:hypothetical protein